MSQAVQPSSSSTSIAIAGGGIIGLSIAWRLAQRGLRVTVFEKSSLGGEASWAGAGMLAPGGEIEEFSPFASLAMESRRLYPAYVRELENTSGHRIDFQERGALDLAYSETEWSQLETRAAAQAALGIVSKTITPEQVITFWPHLRPDGLAGGRFYPDDAIVDPRDVVTALLAACRQSGVLLVSDCSVLQITLRRNAVELRTEQGLSKCNFAVIAAGAWSSRIEIEGAAAVPESEPVRGHLIGYQQPVQTCQTIIRHGHTYLLQRVNGLLIAGASSERVGFARDIDQQIAQRLAAEASFVFPHLGETTPAETWIGFRPGSEELRLGPWHSPRLLLAYGHYRNGILLAPVTAQRIAAAIASSGTH